MAYIGNIPAEKFTSVDIQNFTVSATANYTLDRPVANENEIELFINNVRQHPGSGKAYTASGTALTLSEATAGTDTMYCVYQGKARQTVTPATSSVTNAMLAGSIENAKLSNSAITVAGNSTSLGDSITADTIIAGVSNNAISGDKINGGTIDATTITALTAGSARITGDLTVEGNTVNAQVSNLNVEDRFILLNSGSAAGDAGIIAQTETAFSGSAFAYDDSESRWGFQQ